MNKKFFVILCFIATIIICGLSFWVIFGQDKETSHDEDTNKNNIEENENLNDDVTTGYVSDAIRFKSEHEINNGADLGNGKYSRVLNIPEDNPFVYKSSMEIANEIKNDASFVVYFGFPSCEWCRSALPFFIETADELEIDTIYYVDLLGVREIVSAVEDGENISFEVTREAGEGYYELVSLIGEHLSEYMVSKSDGTKVSTGRKRISAPSFLSVKDGEVVSIINGASRKQTSAYMELTDEVIEDYRNIFYEFLNSQK